MLGIYFSGTGNSKYAIELFCREYDEKTEILSIEDNSIVDIIKNEDFIVFSYPVQYSTVPKILRDFIISNKDLWNGKKVFVIATMALFSGDGAGQLGRLLEKYGAECVGGLHLKMPDNICDEKVLKNSYEKNKVIIRNSEEKIRKSAELMKLGKPTKEGMGLFCRIVGFLGQRMFFWHKTRYYSDKLKINDECVGCGLCVSLCPMENIKIEHNKAVSDGKCAMCYRCINACPKQSITLLGNKVYEQYKIEKYIE